MMEGGRSTHIAVKESMSTKLLQKGLCRFSTDINWIQTYFANFLSICNLNSRAVFHREHLVCSVFMICHWGFDVWKFGLSFKVCAFKSWKERESSEWECVVLNTEVVIGYKALPLTGICHSSQSLSCNQSPHIAASSFQNKHWPSSFSYLNPLYLPLMICQLHQQSQPTSLVGQGQHRITPSRTDAGPLLQRCQILWLQHAPVPD